MSKEYQVWEMLAGVGNFKDFIPVKDLTDDSIIDQFGNRFNDHSWMLLAVQMREQGLLVMEDGKVKLNTCREDPEVVKINFPIGSKQSYIDYHISDGEDMNLSVIVSGYGYIQDRNMPHIITFVVLCRHENGTNDDFPIHPNKFIQ